MFIIWIFILVNSFYATTNSSKMSVDGIYKRIGQERSREFLINEGLSPEEADYTIALGLELEFKVSGNKITRTIRAGKIHEVDDFVLGQPCQEVIARQNFTSIPSLNGNTFILSTKRSDGSEGWSRYHYFKEDGLDVLHKANHGEAWMYFKRL
ncbi:uncharacterized protein LOC130896229 [Diorhabda carinulata]|uniref:uncharacterized protein LOC130896229 n=1 Tax=Diorhabda carinulata TaxID=1163345 RepID=UPI0025A25528|nr:uncharacterized protein LOC130896229 [Diorhabda carinulata]